MPTSALAMLKKSLPPLAAALWLLAGGRAQAAGPAAVFPEFKAPACCQLCPRAANPAAYDTAFLKSFSMLIEGKDGWLFRTQDDLRTQFAPDAAGLASLRHFAESLARRGTTLVMVVQPPRGLMHAEQLKTADRQRYDAKRALAEYQRLLAALRAQGIVVPELDKLVTERKGYDYFFRADHHWTPEGSRRTAQLVAERLRQLPQYGALPKQSFVTTRTGLFAKRGTMHKAALLLCGHGAPDQYVDSFATESEEGDLLGDAKAPSVALVGTSNSDAAYNFSGFLSEYLGSDVLNVSVAGGGMDGAMLSYLPSEDFRKHPPRVLVWELETYHNLSSQDFWRQLLPQLDQGCTGAPKLQRRTKLRAGRNEILFNGGGAVKNLRSRDHMVELRFDDPSVKHIEAVVWYANGRKETVTLELSEHAAEKGRFLFNLRDETGWADQTFLSMDLMQSQAPAKPLNVEAKLCSRSAPRMHTAEAKK